MAREMQTITSLRDALYEGLKLNEGESFSAVVKSARTGKEITFRYTRRFGLSFGGFGTSGFSVSVYTPERGGTSHRLGFFTYDAPYVSHFSYRETTASKRSPRALVLATRWTFDALVKTTTRESNAASVRAFLPA